MCYQAPNRFQATKSRNVSRLRYSIRTLMLGVGVLCAWLALLMHRAKQQDEAVDKIERALGMVMYEFNETSNLCVPFDSNAVPGLPDWAIRLVGKHVFYSVIEPDLVNGK